ncbi:MAG: hypothetical protein HYX69_05095 [Planctomycetia bacterium]|nr:hypothetical protein [Planctomycetia bacterium]
MSTIVTIDDDRMTRVDGRPFFPLAARHMPLGGDPAILRDVGFNALRWAPFGMLKYEQPPREAPRDFGGLMFYAYVYNRGDLSKDADRRRDELIALLRSVKDHPALLGYEQLNEPAYMWPDQSEPQGSPEGMAAGSALIRSLDGRHPIRIGHMCGNLVPTLRKYNAAADIISANPYCIVAPGMRSFPGARGDGILTDHADRTLSVVGRYTDKMRRVADGRQVWMQIQGAANENWYSAEHMPELRAHGIYEHHRRYPTYWEMRFMAFQAIIHGATGLEWMLIRHPIDAPSFVDVRRVIGELRDLHDVLASPPLRHELTVEYTELGFSDWEGVEVLVKASRDGPHVLSANAQGDPMLATFGNLPHDCLRWQVVGENREIRVDGGRLSDRFGPYEVHVYAPAA